MRQVEESEWEETRNYWPEGLNINEQHKYEIILLDES